MHILQYKYRDVDAPGWDFVNVNFEKINLLVGDTATGKSRMLNTIFNLGRFIGSNEFINGYWDLIFEHSENKYKLHLQTEEREGEDEPGVIINEIVWVYDKEEFKPIVERNGDSFLFLDVQMPKLSRNETAISLLKSEDVIQPIHQAFSVIQRRLFHHDALKKVSELNALPLKLLKSMEEKKDLQELFRAGMNLSANLFFLQKYFNETYKHIIDQYRSIFPFVQESRMTDLSKVQPSISIPGNIPVFSIRERGSQKWIPVTQLSSGMQKVLLILTDINILPNGGVYIVDEYENSLGINAIDFFPEYVLELDKEIQFFITSHHPYIINEIPPRNWFVFHRKGMQVDIKYGKELEERFGESKQQVFIQLINDPFFSSGVE